MLLKKTSHSNKKFTQEDLNKLTLALVNKKEVIYKYFNASFYESNNVILSRCFIHDGDNNSALNLYHKANFRVHFKCRTHNCEDIFGSSVLSMLRGALSRVKYNWSKKGDREATFLEAVDFAFKILNVNDIQDLPEYIHNIDNSLSIIEDEDCQPDIISRDLYLDKVQIPSPYHLKRGFSAEILKKYEVGLCMSSKKPMYARSTVPIYDTNGNNIIGITGRSIYDKCAMCSSYHNPKGQCYYVPKWRHSKNFCRDKVLYNLHNAKPYIRQTGVAILVESPGNIWRLEEAGIHNAIAILGLALSKGQQRLLQESGALAIIIIMDNDENKAGQKASLKIREDLQSLYNIYEIQIVKTDIAEMSIEEINQLIKQRVLEIESYYKDLLCQK